MITNPPTSEDAFQVQCVDLLNSCVPDLEAAGLYWCAMNPKPPILKGRSKKDPHGGVSKRFLSMWKKMGLRAGAGDLMFLFRGLLFKIELKIGNAKQNDNQLRTEREVVAAGGEYYIARTVDEFYSLMRWQGVPMKEVIAF